MTQVLSFLCNRFIAQVSDRRLTDTRGRLHDDHTNKCVLYDARASLSYTGLADIEGEPTHLWMANVLSQQPSGDLRTLVEHLARRATAAFQGGATARSKYPTAFAGVAWALPKQTRHPEAVGFRVTNFPHGAVIGDFRVDILPLGPKGPSRILFEAGVPLSKASRERAEALLRLHMKRRASAQAVVNTLVRITRQSAEEDSRIGRSLLSAVIPREAVEARKEGSAQFVATGPADPGTHIPTFEFWEDGVWNGITYGPTLSGPGLVLSSFESGPLHPPLGGLTLRAEGGVTVVYPMALLVGPRDGIVSATFERQAYIATFTDSDLMASFIREHSPGARPRIVESPKELREILTALEPSFDFILLNPNGDDTLRIPISISEILGS